MSTSTIGGTSISILLFSAQRHSSLESANCKMPLKFMSHAYPALRGTASSLPEERRNEYGWKLTFERFHLLET